MTLLTHLAAVRTGWLPSLVEDSPTRSEPLSAEDWAIDLVATLYGDISQFSLDPNLITLICWDMRGPCQTAVEDSKGGSQAGRRGADR